MRHATLAAILTFALGQFALGQSALAQTAAPITLEEVEPPPPIRSNETLEPEADVTIVRYEGDTRYEYRVGGILRGIRVEPDTGSPYLLVDIDGDGQLERSSNPYNPGFYISSWEVLSW